MSDENEKSAVASSGLHLLGLGGRRHPAAPSLLELIGANGFLCAGCGCGMGTSRRGSACEMAVEEGKKRVTSGTRGCTRAT